MHKTYVNEVLDGSRVCLLGQFVAKLQSYGYHQTGELFSVGGDDTVVVLLKPFWSISLQVKVRPALTRADGLVIRSEVAILILTFLPIQRLVERRIRRLLDMLD